MPIYQLVHSGIPLNFSERERLARGITEIHHSETNAPEPFVRVVFEPLPLGTIYTAGEVSPSLLLSCGIRAGRSDRTRHRIIQRCYDLLSEVAQVPPDQIMVVVQEERSSWIMEAGFFLPEPTDEAEAAWIKKLQKAYPGKYDEWGEKGKRPSAGSGHADRSIQLVGLAKEMVLQARREGVDAAGVLKPVSELIKHELTVPSSTPQAGNGKAVTPRTPATPARRTTSRP